jgi:trigger factor
LGDYHNIRLTPEPVEITPEQVDAVIEQLRHQNALWEPVERPVQFGDMVVINVCGSLEGKTILDEEAQSYVVRQDSPFPLPGFAQQLVEMEKGNQKEFTLPYPADYQVKELAGKEYSIQVMLSEIKEEKLPELDDEFARSVDKEVDSVSALRERVLADLTKLVEETANRRFEESVVKAVVDQARVEFPPILVEQEVRRLIEERARQFGGGDKGLAGYLNSVGKSEEELREELRPTAAEIISHSLVLSKVAEEKDIEVSAEEIDAEVENMVKNREEGVEELRKLFSSPEARSSLEQMLLTRKTVQRLVEIATEEGNEDEEHA